MLFFLRDSQGHEERLHTNGYPASSRLHCRSRVLIGTLARPQPEASVDVECTSSATPSKLQKTRLDGRAAMRCLSAARDYIVLAPGKARANREICRLMSR